MQIELDDRIRAHAYSLWENDGRPEGREQFYWFRAVSELTEKAFAEAPATKAPRKRKPAISAAA